MILILHISRSRVGQRFIGLWSEKRLSPRLLFWGNHFSWRAWSYFLLSFIASRLQNNVRIPFITFVNKYFRKNFFDNVEELRYPNMSYRDFPVLFSFDTVQALIDPNSIGFSNKSILINDANKSSIFSRENHNWIERKISNSKYGQIVTLKNFTDER